MVNTLPDVTLRQKADSFISGHQFLGKVLLFSIATFGGVPARDRQCP